MYVYVAPKKLSVLKTRKMLVTFNRRQMFHFGTKLLVKWKYRWYVLFLDGIMYSKPSQSLRARSHTTRLKADCSFEEAQSIFREFHDSSIGGHVGFNSTEDQICQRYKWRNITSHLKYMVSLFRNHASIFTLQISNPLMFLYPFHFSLKNICIISSIW